MEKGNDVYIKLSDIKLKILTSLMVESKSGNVFPLSQALSDLDAVEKYTLDDLLESNTIGNT